MLTVARADPERRRRLEDVADVHTVGDARIDWGRALGLLASTVGAKVVLCEGGPRTIGDLVTADVLDELCLTVAPSIVAGNGPRIAEGPQLSAPRTLALDRVLVADGYLFLRYLRHGSA